MVAAPRSLADACAPIFLFLATFRRNSASSTLSIEELRNSLGREIAAVGDSCEQDSRLAPLFERIWYALVVTADQVVLSSDWPQRTGWSMQLLETHYFNTQEGGRAFYALADEVLNDPTDQAAEMANVLFRCMAMGFQGELLGERRELEQRRRQLYEKARLAGALGDSLTPGAYGRNAARSVMQLPTAGILRFVVVTVAAVIFALLAGNAVTKFKNSSWESRVEAQIDALRGDAEQE